MKYRQHKQNKTNRPSSRNTIPSSCFRFKLLKVLVVEAMWEEKSSRSLRTSTRFLAVGEPWLRSPGDWKVLWSSRSHNGKIGYAGVQVRIEAWNKRIRIHFAEKELSCCYYNNRRETKCAHIQVKLFRCKTKDALLQGTKEVCPLLRSQ